MEREIIDVEIEGIAPLLQHNALASLEGLKGGNTRRRPTRDNTEEWRNFMYQQDGKLVHPSDAIYSCLVQASREFKADRRRTMQRLVTASVFPVGKWMTIKGKKEPDYVHESVAVNPTTKGRIVVYRPAFKEGWRMTFQLELTDPESVSFAKIKEILDYAGLKVGLGSWRPRYGRFTVVKFERKKMG